MSGKRKTKAEKRLADQRHTFYHHTASIFKEVDTKPTFKIKSKTNSKQFETNSYPYLIKDLSKTTILSAAIIAFQIILFIILRNHIIEIPGISY